MKVGAVVRVEIAGKLRPAVVIESGIASATGGRFVRVAYGTTREPDAGSDAICVDVATRDGRRLGIGAMTWFRGENVAFVRQADAGDGKDLCPLALLHRIQGLVAARDVAVFLAAESSGADD